MEKRLLEKAKEIIMDKRRDKMERGKVLVKYKKLKRVCGEYDRTKDPQDYARVIISAESLLKLLPSEPTPAQQLVDLM